MGIVTVCADDFGLTPGISSGILECLEAQRISATSCMTVRPTWREWAASLRPFVGAVDIGLHFTLTHHEPAGAAAILAPKGRLPSLARLLRLSLTRRLPGREIQDQLTRQLDAFEERFGSPPTHIDGHHHVHQLPGVREIVLATLRARYSPRVPYVRNSSDALANVLQRRAAVGRCLAIGLFGHELRALARRSGIPTNHGFSGIYDGAHRQREVRTLFGRFLRRPGPRMLVMCHPGHSAPELRRIDAMTVQRDVELAFLLSDQWVELLSAHGLRLGPLPTSS